MTFTLNLSDASFIGQYTLRLTVRSVTTDGIVRPENVLSKDVILYVRALPEFEVVNTPPYFVEDLLTIKIIENTEFNYSLPLI